MIRRCTVLVLALAASAAGAATPIYRCGNTYSQAPCAGGHVIEASDPRSAAERAEARRVAERERQLAAEREAERRRQAGAAAAAAGFDARGTPTAHAAAASAPAKRRLKDAPAGAKGQTAPASAGSGVIFIAPRPAQP
jgi:hypothetical protein